MRSQRLWDEWRKADDELKRAIKSYWDKPDLGDAVIESKRKEQAAYDRLTGDAEGDVGIEG